MSSARPRYDRHRSYHVVRATHFLLPGLIMTIAPAASPQKSVGQIYCVSALRRSEIHPLLPVENSIFEKFKAGYTGKRGAKSRWLCYSSQSQSVFPARLCPLVGIFYSTPSKSARPP